MLKRELQRQYKNKEGNEWHVDGCPKKDMQLERNELAREVSTLQKLTRNQSKALEKSENQTFKHDQVAVMGREVHHYKSRYE